MKRKIDLDAMLTNTRTKMLNVGCGSKFHKEWINIDMVSNHPDVIEHNILNGLPFPNNHFDVVYHSQVLEHIPRDHSTFFLRECFRVLKPGGIIRIVLPDLENITKEYSRYLNVCLNDENEQAVANYDWIILEMYDQTVRNQSGGEMAKYFERPELINEEYVLGRIGFVGRQLREYYQNRAGIASTKSNKGVQTFLKKVVRNLAIDRLRRKAAELILTQQEKEALRLGSFRNGGEIHLWMYDRYSLGRLLKAVGFAEPMVRDPFSSAIPDWASYELDVKGDMVYDPGSLFMEAIKSKPTA